MDKNQALQQLSIQLSRLRGYQGADWTGLPAELAGVRVRATEVADLASEAQQLPMSELPEWMLEGLLQTLTPLVNSLDEIIAALQPGRFPDGERSRILDRGRMGGPSDLYGGFRDLLNAFSYLGVKAAKFAGAKERCDTAVKNIENTQQRWQGWFDQAGQQHQAMQRETMALISQLRSAAGQSGVSRFAGTFDALSESHRKSTKWWLLAAGGFGALAITAAYLFLVEFPISGNLEQFENVYILVTRLVVIGFAAIACGWCASMYRVRAHLAEVNKHRATALATFSLFVASAEGPEARDAILKASLRAIFAPGLTGLVNSKDEKANNEIIGVIQSMVKGG